jgi:hypothetical protein
MPTCRVEDGLQHERVVVGLAEEERDVFLEEIKEKLGKKVFLYDDIVDYASSLGKDRIDEDLIISYFGGKRHIDKILKDLESIKMDASGKDMYLFHHLLKRVVFIVHEGIISGVYHNGASIIKIDNLIPFKNEQDKITSGDEGLIHFSLIIASQISCPEAVKEILLEQRSNPVFRRAIKEFRNKIIKSKQQSRRVETALSRYAM